MEEKLNLTQEWDKTFPKSGRSEEHTSELQSQGDPSQPLWYHLGGGPVPTQGHDREAGGYRCLWSLRRGEGASVRFVCPDDGGAGFPDHRF